MGTGGLRAYSLLHSDKVNRRSAKLMRAQIPICRESFRLHEALSIMASPLIFSFYVNRPFVFANRVDKLFFLKIK